MATRPSESRYKGGGLVKYLVYRSPQPLRTGRSQMRTRVKRLYFPAEAREIKVGTLSSLTTRSGRSIQGVPVTYRYRIGRAAARRGKTRYEVPERWADRTKVVELPQQATGIRLTSKAPEGPRMAVA
jgi:hypothetical protein